MKRCVIPMLCLLASSLLPSAALPQSDFPNKPITLVVGMVAGGTADLSSRLIGKIAEKHLGQPVAVVNKLGGAGTVGTAAIAQAKPDGYTIGSLLTSPMVTVPHVAKLSYHPVKDIDPFVQYGVLNFAVSVREDSPYKSFKDIMEYARKNPGVITFGTAGANSAQHIIIEEIAREEKVELVHVPFKGGPEALAAAMGGHVSFAAGDFNASLVRARKMRILAMFLSERWADYPDIPTLRDIGYKVPIPYFIGLGGPKGMPEPILNKLEAAFTKACQDPEFAAGMKTIGLPVFYRNRKDFSAFIVQSFDVMGKAIQELKGK
jgi:tripartite-type tricarboxylate transporter receptor subunit TctC